MKVKAVIMLKTRHNDISYHSKKKLMADGNCFTRGNCTYMTDTNDFMLTSQWRPWKRTYITYYFREGHAAALPVPLFEAAIRHTELADKKEPDIRYSVDQVIEGDDKKKVKVDSKKAPVKIIDTGIQGSELNAIFTPKFYQIIARKERNPKQDIMYYLALIAAGASVVGAWLTYKMPETLQKVFGGA